tara:strand:- start:40 stop:303 length:264 start_codon:yes stop_codon:yes gene_type:complete
MFNRKKVYCIVDGEDVCAFHRRGYQLENADYREHVLHMKVGQGIMCGPKGSKESKRKITGLHRAAKRVNMSGIQRTIDGMVYFFRKT